MTGKTLDGGVPSKMVDCDLLQKKACVPLEWYRRVQALQWYWHMRLPKSSPNASENISSPCQKAVRGEKDPLEESFIIVVPLWRRLHKVQHDKLFSLLPLHAVKTG